MNLRIISIGLGALGLALSAAAPHADAQVTLVSQNRSVTASSYYNIPQCQQSNTLPASGFSPFNANLTVQCPGGNAGNATQNSTLSASGFSVQMSAGVSGNAPLSGSSATSSYEVVFDIVQAVPYTSIVNEGQFRLVGPGIDRFLAPSEDSVLQPGRYTLSCTISAVGPGGNPGGGAQNTMTFGPPLPALTIDWYTIDDGGIMNNVGGPFTVSGTIGQCDSTSRAAVLGGPYSITGGFWAVGLSRCDADLNNDGVVNTQDFFDFLTAFFALNPLADFNRSGTINSQDFFDFLNQFFSGCP